MGFEYKGLFKKSSNERLLKTYAKIKKEQTNKKNTGDYGTGRYVPSTEFYGREGIAELKREIKKRKTQGKLSSRAGVRRRPTVRRSAFGGFRI